MKKLKLFTTNFDFMANLSDPAKKVRGDLLTQAFAEVADAAAAGRNVYISFGTTRRGDNFALQIIEQSRTVERNLVYGSYSPSLEQCLRDFRGAFARWADGQADNYGFWPDGSYSDKEEDNSLDTVELAENQF